MVVPRPFLFGQACSVENGMLFLLLLLLYWMDGFLCVFFAMGMEGECGVTDLVILRLLLFWLFYFLSEVYLIKI